MACTREDPEAPSVSTHALIYGNDDRVELLGAPEPFASLGRRSVIAMVPEAHLQPTDHGTFETVADTTGTQLGLCEGEPFAEQPGAATCSGVLVAQDLVLTSAHCLGLAGRCSDARLVIGYWTNTDGGVAEIDPQMVFSCREVIVQTLSDLTAPCQWDMALLRLDRPVAAPAAPVQLRASAPIAGEPAIAIGYSMGLPAKVDLGAHVVDARSAQGDYFTLDSDTFFAGSGSPVFDGEGHLLGLIARGQEDFEGDGVDMCRRARRMARDIDGGAFEEASTVQGMLHVLSPWLGDQALDRSADRGECALDLDAGAGADAGSGPRPAPEHSRSGGCSVMGPLR